MIEAVLFDMNETLFPEGRAQREGLADCLRHLRTVYGLVFRQLKPLNDEYETVYEELKSSKSEEPNEHRRLRFRNLLERHDEALRGQYPGTSIDILASELSDIYDKGRKAGMIPNPGALLFLKYLWEKGITAAIVSNGPKWLALDNLEQLRLATYFEHIFASGEIGYSKPDQRMYQYALDAMHLKPGAALFIDDNRRNVESARNIGMNATVYHPFANSMLRIRNTWFGFDRTPLYFFKEADEAVVEFKVSGKEVLEMTYHPGSIEIRRYGHLQNRRYMSPWDVVNDGSGFPFPQITAEDAREMVAAMKH